MTSLFKRGGDAHNQSTRSSGCVSFDSTAKEPTYGYDPNLAAGIVYTIAFAVIMFWHTFLFIQYRRWWYSAFAVGALGELMGWAARTAAHPCPYNGSLFSLQISILIIAPCFYSAALYKILSELISQYGQRYSPLSARLYLIIFITFDLISIAIQGTGGGLASSEGSAIPPKSTALGTHIMLAGIIIQLVSMSIFCMLWLYFLWAARREPYSKILATTVSFSAACIVIRNYYRAVELGQGWTGYLITHEVYFTILDAALMVLAVLIFNIYYPAKYVTGVPDREGGQELKDSSGMLA